MYDEVVERITVLRLGRWEDAADDFAIAKHVEIFIVPLARGATQ